MKVMRHYYREHDPTGPRSGVGCSQCMTGVLTTGLPYHLGLVVVHNWHQRIDRFGRRKRVYRGR